MKVTVDISPALQAVISDSGGDPARKQWDLPQGACVKTLLVDLGMTGVPVLLIRNNRQVTEQDSLAEGDKLEIFPMVSGG